MSGNVRFADGLRIDGALVGNVSAHEDQPSILVISESAAVTGAAHADHIIINGGVRGPVHTRRMLELQLKARIEGDVFYRALEMHQGARYFRPTQASHRQRVKNHTETSGK